MVACVRSHSLVRPLKSWQQLFAGRGRQAVRRQRSSGQLSGRAGAQAQPDLALDDTERSEAHNWQYPQGGIDAGEEPHAAAVRELLEETSITSASYVAEHPEWLRYDFDAATKARLGARMDAYRGQAQKYILMRFEGNDGEIDLEAPGHTPEFDAFEWVPVRAAAERVISYKRHVYAAVAEHFAPLIAAEVAAAAKSA